MPCEFCTTELPYSLHLCDNISFLEMFGTGKVFANTSQGPKYINMDIFLKKI